VSPSVIVRSRYSPRAVFPWFCKLAVAASAFAVVLTGCEQKKEAPEAAAPAEVLVVEAKTADVPISREWVSTLDGSDNASVQARVQGYLQKQLYQNGNVVKAGDPLFLIDARPFEAAVEQAKANVLMNEAKAVETKLTEERQVKLFASNSVSAAERDQAVQANAAAQANVAASKAALDTAKINLEYTTITAPISGIAGIAKPGAGDLVGPSYGELCSISTVNPIKAVFQISEQEYLNATEARIFGTTGTQTNDNLGWELVLGNNKTYSNPKGEPYKGNITTLNRQFEARTGTVQVEALFPNPDGLLRPGFFARILAKAPAPAGSLVVPQRAVVEVQGKYQVAVVGSDNKVEIRPVSVGDRVGQDWVIKTGLKQGERVVVEGVQMARNGAVVNPKPFVAQAAESAGSVAATTESKTATR
jgi:membrane fusion protein, multidrug efflux system